MGCKKRGAKNRVIVTQKEKRQPGLFSLLYPVFATHILDLTFFRVTNRPMFSKQELWVQIDWASGFAASLHKAEDSMNTNPLLLSSWL